MNNKKIDKQKLLTSSVVIILVFFFIGGFWIGLDRVRSMEGTFPPNKILDSLSDIPSTDDEILSYIDMVFKKATEEGNEKITYSDSFSVDEDSIETDGSKQFRQTLIFAAGNFEDHISSVLNEKSVISEFGNDTEKLLRLYIPSKESIKEMKIDYIYFSCPSCGETSDKQHPLCELCGSEREYQMKYRNEYSIELIFDGSLKDILTEHEYSQLFLPRNDSEIRNLVDGALDDSVVIDSIAVDIKELKVTLKVNRFTDELLSVGFVKTMNIDSSVTFSEKYEALGSKNISFTLNEKTNYGLIWPQLSLDKDSIVIEPKNTDNLLATLTCEDPLAMNVLWTSSDESIATVDEEGYIKAGKTAGEVIITASFEYLGKTYSDTCAVFVRVPVESMKMNKRSVKLGVGESFELKATVSPSSATVKSVTWYTEDDNIAAVDENGIVTGKSNGKVTVYALSDDGYYRSTCEVTVE